jgi:hypothetical protein
MINKETKTIIYEKFLSLEDFPKENLAIISEYICGLCEGIIFKPILDKKGLLYCKQCIEIYLENEDLQGDTSENIRRNLIEVELVNTVLEKVLVYCKNKKQDCDWLGQVRDLCNHLTQCFKATIKCPNQGCQEIFRRDESSLHQESCLFKKLPCLFCAMEISIKERDNHEKNICVNKILPCVLCGELVKRIDIALHSETDCGMLIIDCPFKMLGCQESITKNSYNTHLAEKALDHSLLFLKELSSINYRISDLDNKMNKILDQYQIITNKILEEEKRQNGVSTNSNKENNICSGNYYFLIY